ncbi:hypothetical protein ZWY2020_040709 [Hordeum vulgare]|nr:hypothetical protein ZWY2020_040709 [Hordeum vulgare]
MAQEEAGEGRQLGARRRGEGTRTGGQSGGETVAEEPRSCAPCVFLSGDTGGGVGGLESEVTQWQSGRGEVGGCGEGLRRLEEEAGEARRKKEGAWDRERGEMRDEGLTALGQGRNRLGLGRLGSAPSPC